MIKFSNWNIEAIGQVLGRQYDNLTRSIDVIGDIPNGWVWAAVMQVGENLNIISLTAGEIGLHADLTADMLAFRGDYRIQLRGTDGVKVRHTNIITVAVSESISGDAKWPEVPTEFTQLEQRVQCLAQSAQDAAEQAENARDKYPKIIGGNWQVYDPETGEYVDTGVYAGGDAPYIGENGNWFVGSVDTGVRAQGEPGAPGKTPERGVDYWTEADKHEIISEVLEQVPSGSEIDDTKAQTDKTWSSLTIVDRLAPAFESSGPVVTCNPVEGYPIHVVSQIVPVQSGSGDPSPDNVRPISGWTEATLTHNDTPITLSFGQTVYGGTLDWTTGVLTVGWISHTFNAADSVSENWQPTDTSMGAVIHITSAVALPTQTSTEIPNVLCTSLKTISYGDIFSCRISEMAISRVPGRADNRFVIRLPLSLATTAADIKAWLIDNAVKVAYQIVEPFTIQLTPTEVLALSGTNTIYTDTGDTTVSGRADPNTIIQQLAARIAALEGAATNL